METPHANKNRKTLFLVVFILLAGLTALSFGIANSPMMDQPVTGWTAMMVISAAKAMLVITFFMHLWWERAWKYALTIPTLFMGALLVWLLIPDIGFRTQHFTQDRLKHTAAPENSWPEPTDSATPQPKT